MGKGATLFIQTPRDKRWITPEAWKYLENKPGYELIRNQSKVDLESTSKKKEEVKVVSRVEDDFEVIEFEPITPINADIDEIEDLRVKYYELSGKNPDKRWKEKRLKEEIEKHVTN